MSDILSGNPEYTKDFDMRDWRTASYLEDIVKNCRECPMMFTDGLGCKNTDCMEARREATLKVLVRYGYLWEED